MEFDCTDMVMDDATALADEALELIRTALRTLDMTSLPRAIALLSAGIADKPDHRDEPWWRYLRGIAHHCVADEYDDPDAREAELADLRASWRRPHPLVGRSDLAAALATSLTRLATAQQESEDEVVNQAITELDALSAQIEASVAEVEMMRGLVRLHRFTMPSAELDSGVELGLDLLARSLPHVPDHTPLLDLALLTFATWSGASLQVEQVAAALSRLRTVLDPGDERLAGLDDLESDLLYVAWIETDNPDVERAALDALERLCDTSSGALATTLLRCGEMRAHRAFGAYPAARCGPDLEMAIRWLDGAGTGPAEDLAIGWLLLGMCLWRRSALESTGADIRRGISCLDEALRLGLPEPKHTVTAHAERLTVLATGLSVDAPAAGDVAAAEIAFREALADQTRYATMDLGRSAELAAALARIEMLLFAQHMDVLDVDRVRRNLDLAARRPDPPDEWPTLLGSLRGSLALFVDGVGARSGDCGVGSLVEALRGTQLPEAVEPLRRMIGYASVVAGGRTGSLQAFTSAAAALGHADAPPEDRFTAACADVYLHARGLAPHPQLPAVIDRALAVAAEIPAGPGDHRRLSRHLLPALHLMRENGRPPSASSSPAVSSAATAAMLDRLVDQFRAMVAVGVLDADPVRQEQELGAMERGVRGAPPDDVARGMGAGSLLTMWTDRAEARRDATDAHRGVAWVSEALAFVRGPENPMWTQVTWAAARCHRLRGLPEDQGCSRELGLATLRGHAWMVLLQYKTDHAVAVAREAAAQAVRVARWCLADRAADDLVAALDAGRGLVLQATLTTRRVADRLRAAGEVELAAEWADAGGDDRVVFDAAAGLGLHGDLRRRVLSALGADRTGFPEVTSTASIRAVLRAQKAAALIYLVPTDGDDPGLAVAVPARGPVEVLELPELDAGTAAQLAHAVAPERAGRDMGPVGGTKDEVRIAELLDFGWRAAGRELADLADRLAEAGERPPKLLLAPFGALGLVPWHAARPAGVGDPGVLGRAVVSYVPSAQLLVQAQARPARPTAGALVIGDPTGDLPAAAGEARSIVRTFHPGATYLGAPSESSADDPGPSGPGTATELLARLSADAEPLALLHLACHARAEPSAPGRSSIMLADRAVDVDELLTVRPAAALEIDTVCLAGCSTNVPGLDHDEAFSLATAFLAAGARTAYGSMWTVPDERTSCLMFMVHHHLRSGRCSPAEALHRAQSWAADPDRVAPAAMPAALARAATGDDDPIGWAGFQHLGA